MAEHSNSFVASLFETLKGELRFSGRRLSLRLSLLLAAVGVSVAAILSIGTAILYVFEHYLGQTWAAVCAALVLAGLAAVLWALAWRIRLRKPAKPSARGAAPIGSTETTDGGTLEQTIVALVAQQDAKTLTLLALGLGVALGSNPKLIDHLIGKKPDR